MQTSTYIYFSGLSRLNFCASDPYHKRSNFVSIYKWKTTVGDWAKFLVDCVTRSDWRQEIVKSF